MKTFEGFITSNHIFKKFTFLHLQNDFSKSKDVQKSNLYN